MTDKDTAFDRFEQHVVAGGEYLRHDQIKDAKSEFAAALKLKPADAKALGLLGLACFRLQDFTDALPIYQQLVELLPNDPSHRLNLGLVHLKLGNTESAIQELGQTCELDPSQTRAVSYLGLAYARAGEYGHAFTAFLRAGQTDLAHEMEQHLSAEQRDKLKADVTRPKGERPPTPPPVAARANSEDETIDIDLAEDVASEITTAPLAESADFEAAGDESPPGRPSGVYASVQVEMTAESAQAARLIGDEDPTVVSPSRGGVVTSIVPGAITEAVDLAEPSASATLAVNRVAAGHKPPTTLSEFATARLIRPQDGDNTFELAAGNVLIVRVHGVVMSRTEGVIVSGGDLAYEPAVRRVRGKTTTDAFSVDGRRMFIVSGQGHLVASPLGESFCSVALDDDILYLREDLVFAFEDCLHWENGRVPGSASKIQLVQFRGQGSAVLRSKRPLLSVKITPPKLMYVDADVFAGWIGRVVPRVVAPAAGGDASAPFVECTGEGVILIEDVLIEDEVLAASDDAALRDSQELDSTRES